MTGQPLPSRSPAAAPASAATGCSESTYSAGLFVFRRSAALAPLILAFPEFDEAMLLCQLEPASLTKPEYELILEPEQTCPLAFKYPPKLFSPTPCI